MKLSQVKIGGATKPEKGNMDPPKKKGRAALDKYLKKRGMKDC